jgi:hypothetical protein
MQKSSIVKIELILFSHLIYNMLVYVVIFNYRQI